jgi:ComF family protein
VHRIIETALDFVFPKRCALCDLLGEKAICDSCFSGFEPAEEEIQTPKGIHAVSSLFNYTGRAAQAVKRLKYERATALARPMAELLAIHAELSSLCEADLVVPVPIHWSRRCTRGFNQSELLCESIRHSSVDLKLLRRSVATRPQVGLTPEERRNNLTGAFTTARPLKGETILLVDDVTTSGQTAAECAKTLIEAGAKQVRLLTFAVG